MKKEAIYIIIILALIGIILATNSEEPSNELSGVPDSLVLESEAFQNFCQTYHNCTYDILHKVSTDTHRDDLTLIMRAESSYAFFTETALLSYQYESSNNSWVPMYYDESATTVDYEIKLDAFLSSPLWQGEIDYWYAHQPNCSYSIHIDDIDTENETITFHFEIDFENEQYEDILPERMAKVPLVSHNDGQYYSFNLPADYLMINFTIGPQGITAEANGSI